MFPAEDGYRAALQSFTGLTIRFAGTGSALAVTACRTLTGAYSARPTELKRFSAAEVTVDNFEGIAVQPLSDATDRIVIDLGRQLLSPPEVTSGGIFEYESRLIRSATGDPDCSRLQRQTYSAAIQTTLAINDGHERAWFLPDRCLPR